MTWSYSGNPSASDNDEIRFLTGDVDTTDQLVSDEEIAYAIAQEANNVKAAVRVCYAIAMKFARKADKAVGDLKINYSQQYKQYLDMADTLDSKIAAVEGAIAYAGGISVSDKDTVDADTDRVNPSFSRGMHDNPNGFDPDYSDGNC